MLWLLLLAPPLCLVCCAAAAACVARLRRTHASASGRLRVAFVHPDLGIGGAERLVVDAAVSLQKLGHEVTVYTAHHDRGHCFPETVSLLTVLVRGDWLPRRILGRCYALCAYLRMIYVAACMVVAAAAAGPYDVIVCDQVSFCIPVLRLCGAHSIVFYCHFPDMLLTTRQGLLKRLYRAPIDWAEQTTTGMADVVLVNSLFTREVFRQAFQRLTAAGLQPDVLYPALDVVAARQGREKVAGSTPDYLRAGEALLLSINRFERKKNVALAIRAFAALPAELRSGARLVLAGGHDPRLPENVEHATELAALAEELGVADRVTQRHNISSEEKAMLLSRARLLLYTPDREHFGIVPVEAMDAGVPVLAVNTGGPLESVSDGETGFLRPQDTAQWSEVLRKVLTDADLCSRMGEQGRRRAEELFSLAAFGSKLDKVLRDSVRGRPTS